MGQRYFISPPDEAQPESLSSQLPSSNPHLHPEGCSCPLCQGILNFMEVEDEESSSTEDIVGMTFQELDLIIPTRITGPVTRAGRPIRRPIIRLDTDIARTRQDELPALVSADRLTRGDTFRSRQNRLSVERRQAERDVQEAQLQIRIGLRERSLTSLQWMDALLTMERAEARLNNVMAEMRSLLDEMQVEIDRLVEVNRQLRDAADGRAG